MCRCLWSVLAAAFCCACGGGGGGGGGGPPPPPPPPYSATTETGLAVAANFGDCAALDPHVLVPVSEIEAGQDLNGDGDMLDDVLHAIDLRDDSIRNLALAILGRILTSDLHFAFLVSEGGMAAGDLNGDGDGADAVWHVFDPTLPLSPGNPRNTMLATPSTGLAGAGTTGGFVLLQSESATGQDLNGDLDLNDTMGGIFDGSAFAVSPIRPGPHALGTPLVARAGRVAFASSEQGGGDLNGDGDAGDTVLGVVDFNGAVPIFTLAGFTGRAVANHPYALTDTALVYLVDEATQANLDRNNDGDMMDAVLAVFDIAGGTGEVFPFSGVIPSFGLACSPTIGIAAGSTRILVGIDEAGQGAFDINGDMLANDFILGWVDTLGAPSTAHVLANLTLASVTPRIDGTRGLVLVSERAQQALNGIDLNGDGDDTDNVAFVVDTSVAPGFATNLSRAVATFRLSGVDALLGVDETMHFNADANGNGFVGDVVYSYFDLGDAPPSSRGLGLIVEAEDIVRLSATSVRIAAFIAEGQSPNFNDVNGDGDSNDVVLEFLELDPDVTPPTAVASTPRFGETASLGLSAPLRVTNDTYLIATSETMAATDLNGDGDMFDTVVRIVRVLP